MVQILGIDSGLTVTKAAVFDEDGSMLAVARGRVPQAMPKPHFVERDLDTLWQVTAAIIAEVLRAPGVSPAEIAAIGVSAHGDGLFLLDRECCPFTPGILSLDSRAGDIVERWIADGVAAEALKLTGQEPHAAAPSAILAWLKANDSRTYAAIGSILSCKDWLRFRLTGRLHADRTEASTSFTDVMTQDYSPRALALYGLSEVEAALPPVAGSTEIVGAISASAAEQTGLLEGTPVVCGLHDVTASAIGIAGLKPGCLAIVVGTYSINETVSDHPVIDRRWFCRNAPEPRQWLNMAISPASTANLEWFLNQFCTKELALAEERKVSVFGILAPEIDKAFERAGAIAFHPFLFGSPYGSAASAGFFGLRGWHERGDMIRAVLEGIVFNHRTHIDALRSAFPLTEARLTGGGARSPVLSQMFADATGLPIAVSAVEEAGALGAALAAGVGAGLYPSLAAAMSRTDRIARQCEPDARAGRGLQERFAIYGDLVKALAPIWPRLQRLESGESRAS
jgi:L-xylulokinase